MELLASEENIDVEFEDRKNGIHCFNHVLCAPVTAFLWLFTRPKLRSLTAAKTVMLVAFLLWLAIRGGEAPLRAGEESSPFTPHVMALAWLVSLYMYGSTAALSETRHYNTPLTAAAARRGLRSCGSSAAARCFSSSANALLHHAASGGRCHGHSRCVRLLLDAGAP